jgi:hypothetical protein
MPEDFKYGQIFKSKRLNNLFLQDIFFFLLNKDRFCEFSSLYSELHRGFNGSLLTFCVVDHWFTPRSGQNKRLEN